MVAAGSPPVWRPVFRRLIRAARRHDQRPWLKSLLPVWGGQAVAHCSPKAPPLAAVARAAFQLGHGSLQDAVDSVAVLERNLSRAPDPAAGLSQLASDAAKPAHPNLAWYYKRVEDLCHVGRGRAGAGDAVDVLEQMVAVGCPPPRRLYVHVISALGIRPATFERALDAFWLMDMRSPYEPCTDVATGLVRGALHARAPGGEMRRRAVARALGISRALSEAGLLPEAAVCNTVLASAAGYVRGPSQMEDLLAAVRAGQEAGLAVAHTTSAALVAAHDRIGQHAEAYNLTVELKAAGGSPPAEALVHLLEWASALGDAEKVEFLERELVRTGKAQYLEGASNPSC